MKHAYRPNTNNEFVTHCQEMILTLAPPIQGDGRGNTVVTPPRANSTGVSTTTAINYKHNKKRTNRATVRALRNTLEENRIAFEGSDSEDPNAYITQGILNDGTRVRRIGEPKAIS